ncbi:MAG TPA: fatty acid desaturase [Tepidisphaeraceae bacterium]|jgi:beta-carotene hydroxylase|nr:fatty acid desaturase [Tepidisphaeraceae bacterium]
MAIVEETSHSVPQPPALNELGLELLRINHFQRVMAVILPFALVVIYITFAHLRWWPAAVLTLMYLSFVTYGSISHDLVHRTLGLPRGLNDFFLSAIELMAFRSGHAYRLAHLHHHARFPHDDDIEGEASKMSLGRTLAEGVIFQPRIMIWAAKRHHREHPIVVVEIALVLAWLIFCFATIRLTPIFAVYAGLMIMGSWIIPLITSYLPHNPEGRTALSQTRLFRGKVASIIAMEHLYHLEHHLYPAVPHHNWAKLARRLDPYFKEAGVEAVVLWF